MIFEIANNYVLILIYSQPTRTTEFPFLVAGPPNYSEQIAILVINFHYIITSVRDYKTLF